MNAMANIAAVLMAPPRPADPPATARAPLVRDMLAAIRRKPGISTCELARVCGITSRQVWGRAKWHMTQGIVECVAGQWRIVPGGGRKALVAAEYLRAHGWTVEAPARQHGAS